MMEIIPAIDIIDGKCVRLSQGDFSSKTIYNKDPVEVAKSFEAIGIKRLHIVDLDGAKSGKIKNLKRLEQVAATTDLIIDFGGGIKTDEDIAAVFNAGAALAGIGSIAVKQPEIFAGWLKKHGGNKILLGADVKNEKLAINGWLQETDINIFDFAKDNIKRGITQMFCTDISKDGMLAGPSTELYRKIIETYPTLQLIASGGVSNIEDLRALDAAGCAGAIVGKAIYEGSISMNELKEYLSNGIN